MKIVNQKTLNNVWDYLDQRHQQKAPIGVRTAEVLETELEKYEAKTKSRGTQWSMAKGISGMTTVVLATLSTAIPYMLLTPVIGVLGTYLSHRMSNNFAERNKTAIECQMLLKELTRHQVSSNA